MVESLGDDLLSLILKFVQDPNDRESFSQVCKQWSRVEGFSRASLRVFEPNILKNFISRFPNIIKFESFEAIPNSQFKSLARSCRRIQVLNLNYKEKSPSCYDEFDEISTFDDFDDEGLSAVATGCCDLRSVFLRRRSGIGNAGVISLAVGLRNLVNLDLAYCNKLSDGVLEAIGMSNSLKNLNLQGCWLITDVGLALLAKGSVSKSLKKLILAECDRITDSGILSLREMSSLEELDLADCGPKVTDTGGVAIAAIESLKRLNLSWLVNISDATVNALAHGCRSLLKLDLTGCEFVTGQGLCSFSNHGSLTELILARCDGFTGDDLHQIVRGCRTLEYIILDKRMRIWIPVAVQNSIARCNCLIDWK